MFHPQISDSGLIIPVSGLFSEVESTDTILDLESDECLAQIKLLPDCVKCKINVKEGKVIVEKLPNWVEVIWHDNHVCGYTIKRPHTLVLGEKSAWRCDDEPDKLYTITVLDEDCFSGGLLELSLPKGKTRVTKWENGKSQSVVVCTAENVLHFMDIVATKYEIDRIRYTMKNLGNEPLPCNLVVEIAPLPVSPSEEKPFCCVM